MEVAHDEERRQKGCQQQESRLQSVGPHHRLDAAFEGIKQNDGDEDDRRHPKRYAPVLEDELIQHKDNEIHPQRRAQQSRQNEKRRARLLRPRPETHI